MAHASIIINCDLLTASHRGFIVSRLRWIVATNEFGVCWFVAFGWMDGSLAVML